jgi:hypothetical protein
VAGGTGAVAAQPWSRGVAWRGLGGPRMGKSLGREDGIHVQLYICIYIYIIMIIYV